MRKKLNGKSGLTLVEMLAATLVLVLLTLMLVTGMQMAMSAYENIIAQNEVELLLSTAVDRLSDELRYARNVKWIMAEDGKANFKYTSNSYGHNTNLTWVSVDSAIGGGIVPGQLLAISEESGEAGYGVLSTGAYGSEDSYKDYVFGPDTSINYDRDEGVFSFRLTAMTKDGRISASTPQIIIRCLNPPEAENV